MLPGTLTNLLIRTEHATKNDDRNNESTIKSGVQQLEEMSGSSSDIFYNYENDSDEYYSLEDFDVSTNESIDSCPYERRQTM